ncbi:MAG TPA: hypothetical protein VMF50_17305 [Candidatus Binataceae bacterium]|nr:hypothetical protein [Candidatus Binataceae bacterium]
MKTAASGAPLKAHSSFAAVGGPYDWKCRRLQDILALKDTAEAPGLAII